MNRARASSRLVVLSAAIALAACGGGDPQSADASGGVVAADSSGPPCPVIDVNGQCVMPGTAGGTPSTMPPEKAPPQTPPPTTPPATPPTTPPATPPTTPPTTPPSANSDPCVIPTPGFSGTYRSTAKPELNIRVVTTGSTQAPVETTTFSADGITTQSTADLLVTLTASGGPQLSWTKVRTETTAPGMSWVQEYSVDQTLELPMQPGDSQITGGAVSGTHNMVVAGTSCSGAVSGSQVVTYTYAGIDPVTVPAGTFAACRFSVTRVSDIRTTCDNGHGTGQNTDTTALWVQGGHIIKSVGADGSALELVSYTQ